jgi:hypothetical protein
VAGVTRDVLPLFDAGAIRVVVDTVVQLRAYLVDRFMGCGQSCCVRVLFANAELDRSN